MNNRSVWWGGGRCSETPSVDRNGARHCDGWPHPLTLWLGRLQQPPPGPPNPLLVFAHRCPSCSPRGPPRKERVRPTHPLSCEDKPRGPQLWGAAPGSCCSHWTEALSDPHLECCSLQTGTAASRGRAGVRQLVPSGAASGSPPPVVCSCPCRKDTPRLPYPLGVLVFPRRPRPGQKRTFLLGPGAWD